MAKNTNIFFLSVFMICLPVMNGKTQHQLLLEEKVDNNFTESKTGPNQRHYIETRVYYGLGLNNPDQYYPLTGLGSREFELGLRYKLKISPTFSTGIGAGYFNQSFRVDTETKSFPDKVNYDREVFRFHSLKSNIFIRINIDPRRGDFLGKYIESGFFGGWSFAQKRIMLTRYGASENTQINKSKEKQSGLGYIDNIQYGAFISIGVAGYEISFRHRFSSLIQQDILSLDFTPNTIGVSVGLNF